MNKNRMVVRAAVTLLIVVSAACGRTPGETPTPVVIVTAEQQVR